MENKDSKDGLVEVIEGLTFGAIKIGFYASIATTATYLSCFAYQVCTNPELQKTCLDTIEHVSKSMF